MSAFRVETSVIQYLLEAADRAASMEARNNRFSWFHQDQMLSLTQENYQQVGQMLCDENQASLLHLYTHNREATELFSAELHYIHRHAGKPFKLGHVQALKTLDYYIYQTNNHPNWQTSQAHAFTKNLRSSLIRTLPGYQAEVWGAPPSQG